MLGTKLLGCTAVALLAAGSPASAQVVRDGSLGEGTIAAGIDSDGLEATYVITEKHGKFLGQNLFHSFSDFSVGSGDVASFTLTSDCAGCSVNNIIAGVSGGFSDIDGMIRTTSDLSGAALFLLNPAGIFFGKGAELDVKGSFHASTADVLRFSEGAGFDVFDTSPDRILNSAQPFAFGFTGPDLSHFGEGATPRLTVRDTDLQVEPGATLSLIGGDDADFPGLFGTEISASGTSPVIFAPDATVQIAAAGRPGINIPVDLIDLDMGSLDPGDLGAVVVNRASVIVGRVNTNQRAGTVVIRAGLFKLAAGAQIAAVNSVKNDDLEPDLKDALGPIDIATTGDIVIETGSKILTWTSGIGASGDVLLDAGQLVSVTGGSSVQSFATNSGQAGAIAIDADRIVFDGGKILGRSSSTGDGGAIDLNARGIEGITLAGGASVISEVRKAGIGGDIDVRAQSLTISNQANDPVGTFIATNTFSSEDSITEAGDGDGGNLTVDVDTLELLEGGQLIANTEGAANAGAVTVNASSLVHLSGTSEGGFFSGIASNALKGATGAGGRIAITSPIVEVQNGAQIASETIGAGAAGAVDIIASDRVTIEGGENGFSRVSAASFVQEGSSPQLGPGGTIRIEADQFELRNGGQISASTSGTGDAGSIDIAARNIAISGADPTGFNESAVFSQSLTFGVEGGGDGGDITITGFENVSISDGGLVRAKTDGPGLGGSIEITAGRSLRLDGALVSADASDSGDAGNIDIVARGSLEMVDSAVTTKATSSSGGNIEITANSLIHLESSQIETEVIAGDTGQAAGDVTAQSEIAALNHSHIIANAAGAGVDAGNISITVDQLILSGDSFLQASAETGVDGTINVSSPDADLTGTLATLPDNFLDASALLARDCAARTTRAGSFAVETRGEFSPLPDAMLELYDAAAGITRNSEEEQCLAVEDLS
jgi:filamentous hemagglutinin family protein